MVISTVCSVTGEPDAVVKNVFSHIFANFVTKNPPHGLLARSSSSTDPLEHGLQSSTTLAAFQTLMPPLTLLDVDITCKKKKKKNRRNNSWKVCRGCMETRDGER